MGGPGSGSRKGNPAENRKKKAKTKLLTVRMWDWQYDKVAADAEAAGLNISEHTLEKLEVAMKVKFVYDDTKEMAVITTGREVDPNAPDYSKGYNAYPGEINGKEAIQIFSIAEKKSYLEMVGEQKVYEIIEEKKK